MSDKPDNWADQMENTLAEAQKNNIENPGLEVLKKLYPIPANPSLEQSPSRVGGRTIARKPPTEAKIKYKNFKRSAGDETERVDLVKLITNHLSAKFAAYGGFGYARCKKILEGNPLYTKKETHWNSWQKAITSILNKNSENLSNLEDYYGSSDTATGDRINEKIEKFLKELPSQIAIFEASLTREKKETKINDIETINILNIESFNDALEILLGFATINWSS